MKTDKKKSVTLVEIMVVVAIFSSVFGTILYFTVVGEENLSIINTKVTLQQDLRRAMRIITEDLSQAIGCNLENEHKIICEVPNPDSWIDGMPTETEFISYELNTDNIIQGEDVIVSNIDLILELSEFKKIKNNELQIFITAERGNSRSRNVQIEIGSNVYLRNYGI